MAAPALLAIAAVGCTKAASPQGWAPPEPVTVDNQQLIIAAHKAKLYALPPNVTTATWQFPPVDKNSYPIATVAAAQLDTMVDALSISPDQKTSLHTKVKNLNVQGPSVNDFKDAVKVTSAADAEKSKLTDAISAITTTDKDALSSLQAFYGDIGVSADSRTLYAAAFRGYVFALDAATGHMVWLQKLDSEMIGGVAVSGATVYFGSKGKQIFAADAATGSLKWTFEANGEIWSTPTVTSDSIYVTSLDGTVYALDDTGKTRWTFKNPNAGIAGSAAVSGDAVYVGAFDNKLYSIKVSDGTMNWSHAGGNWFWGAPRVQDGVVYAANLDGKVYAIDDASGALKWDKPFDTGSPIRSAPTIAGDALIVANKAGQVYKLDLASGQAVGSSFNAGSTIYANLTMQAPATVYVSPQSPQLIVLDASGDLTVDSTYGLAQ